MTGSEREWIPQRLEWKYVWEQRYHDKSANTLGQRRSFKGLNGEKDKDTRMIDNNNGIEEKEGRKKKKRKAQADGLNHCKGETSEWN